MRPVGGKTEVPVDVRVIAATNRDLEAPSTKSASARISTSASTSSRSRCPRCARAQGDVLPLAQHFLEVVADARRQGGARASRQPAAEKLVAYAWPGNVRELQNCIERAVALARFEELRVEDLPEKVRDYRSSHVVVAGDDPSELVPLEEVERRYILRVLEAVGRQQDRAARILGIERKTLYRKLERYGA